jgi:hypothetical protein
MRNILAIIIYLAAIVLFVPELSAQPPASSCDYVFLVDVSGSMAGEVGHPNIFPSVKQAIQQFVQGLDAGSTVFFFPFDERIREMKEFRIQSDAEKSQVVEYLQSLRANGNSTAIYRSIHASLERVNDYRRGQPGERTIIFFVYTDGDDNVSKEWNLASILDHFNLKRGERDWLYYTELGVPSNPQKQRIFDTTAHVTYVPERQDSLHQIIHVETLIPNLNFGNLKSSPKSTRVEKFEKHGGKSLPKQYNVSIEPVFKDLQARGGFAEITPKAFFPTESVNLELSLVNSEGMAEGEYHGTLKLVSSDPLVLIAPNEIDAVFAYRIAPEVEILPTSGDDFPLNVGDINVYSNDVSSREARKTMLLRFNSTAKHSGEKLKVTLLQDPSDDKLLDVGKTIVIDPIQGTEGWIGPETKQLQLIIRGTSDLSSGTYHGKILFESDKIGVVGKGLESKENSPTVHAAVWSFKIPRKPIPWWIWLLIPLILGAIGFVLVRRRLQPPVLTDLKLEVREPEVKEIDLAGKNEVRFGKGGEYLQDSDVVFLIRAKREGRSVHATIQVQDGQVLLKKSNEHEEVMVIGEEKIFDGDILKFGPNKVLVSSYSLNRE